MEKRNHFILGLLLAIVMSTGAGVGLVFSILTHVPNFGGFKSSVRISIVRKDGTRGFREVGPKAPLWVPLSDISDALISAVIASEDTSFFSHKGIDFHEIQEAIRRDIKEKRWARGASTLTQQVIKNVFLSSEKTLWRKLKEILWARGLETELTKSQILCFYLNLVEWGPGIYGISETSYHYFGASPAVLTHKQAAFLAMLLPSPRRYHIYFQKRDLSGWALRRVTQILHTMHRMGFMDGVALAAALSETLWEEKVEVEPVESEEFEEDWAMPGASEEEGFFHEQD